VLDAALALESHIDIQQPLHRGDYARHTGCAAPEPDDPFQRRFAALPARAIDESFLPPACAPFPPHPERDLLWFIARHAPELAAWEQDIFWAVREEAYYFYPLHACHIMNEGWASYWHARLLREADFLPHELFL